VEGEEYCETTKNIKDHSLGKSLYSRYSHSAATVEFKQDIEKTNEPVSFGAENKYMEVWKIELWNK
jgi:hypothetical protein